MFETVTLYREPLIAGLALTLRVSGIAFVCGLLLALLLFAGRTSRSRSIRMLVIGIIEAGKGIPALVIMFWLYLCLPLLLEIRMSAETAAIGALAFNYGVNAAEVFRSAWTAVSGELREALGLFGTPRTTSILFFEGPFLLNASMPGLLAQLAATIKLSAVAAFIGVPEIFHATQSVIQQTYRPVELYSTLALFYLVIVLSISGLEAALAKRVSPKKD